MSRPQVKEHNSQTNEQIVRDMTADELNEYEAFQASEVQKDLDAKAAATAKAELLERLGITEDEAKLLLA